MSDIAVIILTGNEKLHIGRCLERLQALEPRQVFVVDCLSDDGTVEIAQGFNSREGTLSGKIEVVRHPWPGLYARQFNWALDNCKIGAEWILRLDADEYLLPETIVEVRNALASARPEVSAYAFPLARTFLGQRVRFGVGTLYLTRLFRRGIGRCEERMMDEHIILSSGETRRLRHPFVDDNLNGVAWWTKKHIGYAEREAIDALSSAFDQGERGSAKKKNAYYRLPPYFRAFAYFCLRYILRGGFLDGRAGFMWHFLQGWWYRTLVDVRMAEIRRVCRDDPARLKAWIEARYGANPGGTRGQ